MTATNVLSLSLSASCPPFLPSSAPLPEALGAAAALHSTTTTSKKAMYDFRATASMMSYAEIDMLCSASQTDKQQSLREH